MKKKQKKEIRRRNARLSGPGSTSVVRGLGIENFRLAGKNLFFERIYRTNGNPRMFGLDRDRERMVGTGNSGFLVLVRQDLFTFLMRSSPR